MRAFMSDRDARHASLYTGYPTSDNYTRLGHLPIAECEAIVILDRLTVTCASYQAEREAQAILRETEPEKGSYVAEYQSLGYVVLSRMPRNVEHREALAESLAAFVGE